MPNVAAELGSSTTEDTAQQISGEALLSNTPWTGLPQPWDVDHDGQPFADQFVRVPSDRNPHPAKLIEGYDYSNKKMFIELPPLAEAPKGDCWAACALKQQKLNEECAIQRRRVALWLKNNGCPSTVTATARAGPCGRKPAATTTTTSTAPAPGGCSGGNCPYRGR